MSFNSKFLPKARLELLEAWIWYEDRQPGLGDRFKEEIFKAIVLVEQNPERYAVRKKPYYEKPVKVSIPRLTKEKKQLPSFQFFILKDRLVKNTGNTTR